jgi:O-antigen/teichoic acid export membrane protein
MNGRLRQLVFGRFARDTAATQISLGVTTLCNLGASIILWRGLGKDGYGMYALVFARYGMIATLNDLAHGKVSTSLIAQARGAGDRQAFVAQVAYALKMTALAGVAVTVIGLIIAPLAAVFYGTAAVGPYAMLLFVAGIGGFGRAFTSAVLGGVRRMGTMAVFEASFGAVRLAAIGGAILAGLGVWGALGAHVIAVVVLSAAGFVIYRRLARQFELPGLGALVGEAIRVPWWATFRIVAPIALDRQLLRLVQAVPVLLLGKVTGSKEACGYYHLAWSIVINLGLGFAGLARNLLPFFAELRGKQQLERLRRNYRRTVAVAGLAGIALAAVCVPLLPPVLRVFYGQGRAALAAVAYALLPVVVVDGFCIGVNAFVVVTERGWWASRLKLVSLAPGVGAMIGAALAGMAWWSDALVGAAIGAAAAYTVWWAGLSLYQLVVSFRALDEMAARAPADASG